MTPEEFEQRLATLPVRQIPAEWESEILAAAQAKIRQPFFALLLPMVRAWLWPHPVAWACVVVVWLAIAGLNFSGPQGDALTTTGKAIPPRDPAAFAAEIKALRLRNEFLARWTQEPELPPRHRL